AARRDGRPRARFDTSPEQGRSPTDSDDRDAPYDRVDRHARDAPYDGDARHAREDRYARDTRYDGDARYDRQESRARGGGRARPGGPVSGPGPRPGGRRRPGLLQVVLVLAALVVGVSLGRTLALPGDAGTVSRLADWGRANHLSFLVDRVDTLR
ncbi:hypothetical protein ND748_28120, partial [Frankia sp. AiPs1]|nr:hypothetical protein [Frankia sp. AiPs1]